MCTEVVSVPEKSDAAMMVCRKNSSWVYMYVLL